VTGSQQIATASHEARKETGVHGNGSVLHNRILDLSPALPLTERCVGSLVLGLPLTGKRLEKFAVTLTRTIETRFCVLPSIRDLENRMERGRRNFPLRAEVTSGWLLRILGGSHGTAGSGEEANLLVKLLRYQPLGLVERYFSRVIASSLAACVVLCLSSSLWCSSSPASVVSASGASVVSWG
jgi:hypothetical protein